MCNIGLAERVNRIREEAGVGWGQDKEGEYKKRKERLARGEWYLVSFVIKNFLP